MFFIKFFILYILIVIPNISVAETLTTNNAIVLMYHRIEHKKSSMTLQPESFYMEMSYLYENHYNVISSVEFINAIINKKTLPNKSVVITFDDGWKSQLYTMDTLKKYHYSATFALITECINKKGYISKYINENFIYVNHSRTHNTNDFLNNPDVNVSKQELLDTTNNFIPIYVYPYGKYNQKLIDILKKSGYIAAFGVGDGIVNIKKTNIYYINRFLITDKTTLKDFEKILFSEQ